ncbi:hypothetical protein FB567DRAFT_447117, partial [Paraphoma chrysanthemicola]
PIVTKEFAGNITFLIKYTAGPDLKADAFTVSIVDVRGPNNSEIGHKATVCFHEGPGQFAIVIAQQVKWGKNVLLALTEKVDKAVLQILAKEGNDGHGDF